MWLNDNELTGEIPPELGELTKLEDLRFGGNQFSGCVPEELKEWAEEMPVCGEGHRGDHRAGRPALLYLE